MSEEEIRKLKLLIRAIQLSLAKGEWSINGERIDESILPILWAVIDRAVLESN